MTHILIIRAAEHKELSDEMTEVATTVLDTYSASYDVVDVPSVAELPLAVNLFVEAKTYDAVITVGVLINNLGNDTKKVLYDNVMFHLREAALYYGFVIGVSVAYDESMKNALKTSSIFAHEVSVSVCEMVKAVRQFGNLGNQEYASGKLHN